MSFWIIAALLACAATASVLWPLIGAREADEGAARDRDKRLSIYRDRRDEIKRELEAGRLSADEALNAERELLDDVADSFEDLPGDGAARDSVAHSSTRRPLLAAALALAIPLLALGVYQRVGAPGADAALAGARDAPARQLAELRAAIGELESRTRDKPDDGESWAMLAGAHKLLGENQAAIPAFENALRLLGPNARLLAELAESIAIGQGGSFAGRPTELLEQALAADPRDIKSNGLMGAAMFQAGRLERARVHLQILLDDMAPDSAQAEQIRAVIARIDEKTGAAGTPPQAPAPAAPLVAGRVEIDPALQARMPANAQVFVNARAPSGSRMPFAAIRLPPGAVPGSFALGDAQSMLAQRKLSGAEQVVVEVRISASGNAARASGDLYGVSETVKPGSDSALALHVRIDQVVP